jgi:hypothetical protein
VAVDHNRFENANGGVQGHGVNGLVVSVNVFQGNVKNDDQIGVFGGYRRSSNITFSDNVIDKGFNGSNRGWGRGIIVGSGVTGVRIENNRVENINSTNAEDYGNVSALGGIVLEVFELVSSDIQIINNTITNCRWGIRFGPQTQGLTVSGNRISDIQTFVFKTPIQQHDFAALGINLEGNTLSNYGTLLDTSGYF